MRTGAGIILPPRPELIAAPNSIYREDATKLTSLGSTQLAKNLADQLMYGNAAAGAANQFFNYDGMGYGGAAEGFNNFISWQNFTEPIWYVPYEQPRVKLWLVEEEGKTGGPEETLRTGEVNEKVQKLFESVPLPTLALIWKGQINSIGTDGDATIISTSTNERWEIHRLGKFLQGPHEGEWKFGYGHYQSNASEWNGVRVNGTGTLSASALALADGVITLRDIVRVLRGGEINHAIGIATLVRANEHLAPALENDHGENPYEFLENGSTPNPAFGAVDAVPEGLWVRFPTASKPSEYGVVGKLAFAIYEAIRKYGLVVRDGCGSGTNWPMEDLRTLYTPYCGTVFDPTAGVAKFATYAHENVPEAVWKDWADPSLRSLTEELNGPSGVLAEIPVAAWRTIEQLEPRSG